MSTTQRSLDVIQVETPCTADWESMRGGDRVRFCDHCQKNVHNLSAMTEDEATRLVCEQAGELCVRYSRDAKGRTATLDYQPTPKRRMAWPLWAFVGAAAAVCAWVVGVVGHGPGRPTAVMGMMPYPSTRSTTSSAYCPTVLPNHSSATQATTYPSSDDGAS